jgi:hypothetical protein
LTKKHDNDEKTQPFVDPDFLFIDFICGKLH